MRYTLPKWFELPNDPTICSDLVDNPFQMLPIAAGDVVLDCGAYVGMFAVAALRAGAGRVICFEPIVESAAICRRNLAHYQPKRWKYVRRVIVPGRRRARVRIEVAGLPSSSSIMLGRNVNTRGTRRVPVLGIRDALAAYHPHVIKMDIELAEYAVLRSLRRGDLAGVRALHIEFHRHRQHVAEIREIRTYLREQGFVEVNGRATRSTWLRGPLGLLAQV